MMSLQPYAYYDSGDYEINNHTRGISAAFTDQINPQNLLEAEASYTTATGARIYNEQMFGYGRYYGNAFAETGQPECHQQRNLLQGRARANGGDSDDVRRRRRQRRYVRHAADGRAPLRASTKAFFRRDASAHTCGGVTCAYYADRERGVRIEQHRDARRSPGIRSPISGTRATN